MTDVSIYQGWDIEIYSILLKSIALAVQLSESMFTANFQMFYSSECVQQIERLFVSRMIRLARI